MKLAPVSVGRARSLLEETAEELYELAPCGYLSALPDGTIIRANEKVAAMTGRPVDEIVGQVRLQELLTTGGRIYYETHVSPLLLMQGMVEEIALELRNPAGTVPVLLNAVLRRGEGAVPVGIRCTLINVTERRRYEREILAARDEAEEAARAKSELVSMVSHDIRSPLAALMTVGELFETTQLTADQEKFVRILKSSTRNLLDLINDVLDLGKIEAGRMSLELKSLDVGALIESLAEELRIKAESKGLSLDVVVDADMPEHLVGDRVKLGRVISNLLGNAIKFSDHGGVRLAATVLASSAEDITLLLEVSDTGIGINQEQLEHIFDDFTQGSEEIANRYGGSGLGLGICKKLLALHGSTLNVESVPGKGSKFWFELKLDRA